MVWHSGLTRYTKPYTWTRFLPRCLFQAFLSLSTRLTGYKSSVSSRHTRPGTARDSPFKEVGALFLCYPILGGYATPPSLSPGPCVPSDSHNRQRVGGGISTRVCVWCVSMVCVYGVCSWCVFMGMGMGMCISVSGGSITEWQFPGV